MKRCDFCFKEKSPLQSVYPNCEAKVCKGCFYEIDRVVGFLEHYGIDVNSNLFGESHKPSEMENKPPKKDIKSANIQ